MKINNYCRFLRQLRRLRWADVSHPPTSSACTCLSAYGMATLPPRGVGAASLRGAGFPACRFAPFLRPVGARISLINRTHGVAVGYSITPRWGCKPMPGGTVNRPRLAVVFFLLLYTSKLCLNVPPCRYSKHAEYMPHVGIHTLHRLALIGGVRPRNGSSPRPQRR